VLIACSPSSQGVHKAYHPLCASRRPFNSTVSSNPAMSWSRRNPAFTLLFITIFAATCDAQGATPVHRPTIGTVFPTDNEVIWRTLSSTIHLLGTFIHSGGLFALLPCAAPPVSACKWCLDLFPVSPLFSHFAHWSLRCIHIGLLYRSSLRCPY
jgi:hypothetical protein